MKYLLALMLLVSPCWAQGIRTDALTIPAVISHASNELEAIVVRPDDRARHPLALINHGSPRDAADRPKMSPISSWPQAVAFARRGWVAVAFMRRGFGQSHGMFVNSGACGQRDYFHAGVNTAEELAAVAVFMRTQPYVSDGNWISVGVSAGGFASVALAAARPAGLGAVIAFAPGVGSNAPDAVCDEDRLIDAFGIFGKTSRVPLLWVSAPNDHFFGPALVAKMRAAFTASSGNLTFLAAPDYGKDGHFLFSKAGEPIWAPMVDDFFAAHGLTQRTTLLTAHPDIAPPPGLRARRLPQLP